MTDLLFPYHARREMARDQITEAAVYHVVEDADEISEHADGRTEDTRARDGRTFVVDIEDDNETVVTAWEDKRRRRRPR